MTERTGDIAAAMLAAPAETGPRGRTLADAIGELVARVERREPIIETVACGLKLLDETAGGLVRGEFCGLVAGPGAGKSTLADRLVVGTLRAQPTTSGLVFALETATPVRVARLLAGDSVTFDQAGAVSTCVPLSALLHGRLDSTVRVRETARRLAVDIGSRLRFVEDVYGAADIAETIVADHPDIVIVDHMGLVLADGSSAVEQMDGALALIHDALREANAAGVLISELNKVALASGAVDLAGVRGSARFASLAGQFVAIVRDDDENARDPMLRLRLLKNRHGRKYVEQACHFLGGLGHLHFGAEIEPIKRRKHVKAVTDAD